MIRSFWELLKIQLFGNGPSMPRFLSARADTLYRDGLTRMVALGGGPGTGKTYYLADHLIDYKKKYPDEATFVLDWKGDLTDVLFRIALSDRRRDWLMSKIILHEVGHPKLVVPLPLFHPSYDPGYEWDAMVNNQVARVQQDFEKLNWRLVEENPTLGGIPIKYMLPNFLKLALAVSHGSGQAFGITEIRRFLRLPEKEGKNENETNSGKENETNNSKENELMFALKEYGRLVPRLKEYFFEEYFKVPYREKDLRTNALRSILNIIEADDIRAMVGYDRPAWTPALAIKEGKIVIIDTSRLIGREAEQNFVSRYVFSLILAEIKKRRSLNAGKPVKVVLDDASEYFNNQAISAELAGLPNNYRSKKLHLYLTFQNLGQLTSGVGGVPGLKENFFTIGNLGVFELSDFKDAYAMSEQLFSFSPTNIKVRAKTETQHDIMENRDEQTALRAAQIQRFAARELFLRRYYTESKRDPDVRHISKTRDVRITVTDNEVVAAKEEKLKEVAVDIKHALAIINRRKLTGKKKGGQQGKEGPLTPESV